MQDALFGTIEDTILHYYATGDMLVRNGNSRTHLYSPYDVCECKDGWVAFSALTQKGFEEFCKEAGREDLLADERFATNDLRCANNDALIAEMKKVFAEIAMDEMEMKSAHVPFDGAYRDETINGMMVLVPEMDLIRDKLSDFLYGT